MNKLVNLHCKLTDVIIGGRYYNHLDDESEKNEKITTLSLEHAESNVGPGLIALGSRLISSKIYVISFR